MLGDKQRAAGVDRDHLVEEGDAGLHRRRDLAAEATAIDNAVEVEPLNRLADALLRLEIEGQRAAGGLLGERRQLFDPTASGDRALGIVPIDCPRIASEPTPPSALLPFQKTHARLGATSDRVQA